MNKWRTNLTLVVVLVVSIFAVACGSSGDGDVGPVTLYVNSYSYNSGNGASNSGVDVQVCGGKIYITLPAGWDGTTETVVYVWTYATNEEIKVSLEGRTSGDYTLSKNQIEKGIAVNARRRNPENGLLEWLDKSNQVPVLKWSACDDNTQYEIEPGYIKQVPNPEKTGQNWEIDFKGLLKAAGYWNDGTTTTTVPANNTSTTTIPAIPADTTKKYVTMKVTVTVDDSRYKDLAAYIVGWVEDYNLPDLTNGPVPADVNAKSGDTFATIPLSAFEQSDWFKLAPYLQDNPVIWLNSIYSDGSLASRVKLEVKGVSGTFTVVVADVVKTTHGSGNDLFYGAADILAAYNK